LYAWRAFLCQDQSTEAGFKYLLFGAMTSAVMLYGFSLLYGFLHHRSADDHVGLAGGG
jgi:NADH-quinone oxidoreductase subunit N